MPNKHLNRLAALVASHAIAFPILYFIFYNNRPVLKPKKHRLICLYCAMLYQFSLKYIQYSCGKFTAPDPKDPASFGTSTVLEQV